MKVARIAEYSLSATQWSGLSSEGGGSVGTAIMFHAIPVLSRRPMWDLRSQNSGLTWTKLIPLSHWKDSNLFEDGGPESHWAFGELKMLADHLVTGPFSNVKLPVSCELRATYDFLVISHLNAGDSEEALKSRPQKPPWNIVKHLETSWDRWQMVATLPWVVVA